MNVWHSSPRSEPNGTILLLPTGAGKTFTAVHFLCTSIIDKGYKILWLAHTHHLLEQASATFGRMLGLIPESRTSLDVRVVSGAPGQSRANTIKQTDDVLLISLQTASNAIKQGLDQFQDFLNAAGDKLFVVFDECHHSPAPSYRNLLLGIRSRHPGVRFLGLTATPTYSQESKRGWLLKLFPQEFVYQANPRELMALGILAKPVLHDVMTNFDPNFNEREVRKWLSDFGDLPEEIIDVLANDKTRNDAIVRHYVDNRAKYGTTVIFADRWFQCDYLREALIKRDVRADVVYSKIDADPGSVEARNRRSADENKLVLESFQRNELDVLINVRMLTEGTDVPDLQTVFLTRKTTSHILLTQMIGRALRGPEVEGTENAYIVSFIDNWKHAIRWAEFELEGGGASEDSSPSATRLPVRLVSIELVRRLAQQMDTGRNLNDASYLSYLPVGWYTVVFDSVSRGSDEVTVNRKLIGVFDGEQAGFKSFINALSGGDSSAFQDADLQLETVRELLAQLEKKHFKNQQFDRISGPLVEDLFAIARHIAQNQSPPAFLDFDARSQHDMDSIVQEHLTSSWNVIQIDAGLRGEYRRLDLLWHHFYPSYEHFKSHYDAAMNRELDRRRHGEEPVDIQTETRTFRNPENVVPREPDEPIKQQVKHRDGYRCLCCGNDRKADLRIDHIYPAYRGGLPEMENLQTLCKTCNGQKGTETISFRTNHTLLTRPPQSILWEGLPARGDSRDAVLWERFLRRTINFA